MSQSEESINLLSPSLDDRCSRATKHNNKTNHRNHGEKNNNAESKSNGGSIPEERAGAKFRWAGHPKRLRADETKDNIDDTGNNRTATNAKESKFASRRDYAKAYTRKAPSNEPSKRPSDEFLRRALPFRTSKNNVRNIESISKDMEVSLILNSTVEVPILDEADRRGGGWGGVLSQLTCLDGGTQMYTGRRDDDDDDDSHDDDDEEEDGEKRLLGVEKQEYSAHHEIRDLPKDAEEEDVFEFKGSQEKQTTKTTAESKPEHVKVKGKSAAAKRRKKGPTEKALAECDDFTQSIEEGMENMDDVDDGNNVDFVNHDDAKDPLQQNVQTIPNSQKHHPGPPEQHTQQLSPIQTTTSQAHPPKSTQTAQQTILANYTAIENMSRALTCPICCHSLKSATFLPCGHAFCKSCLSSSFSATTSKSTGGPGAGSCPVCRHKCGKRSMMPIAQLDEIVRAYKGIMRAFGFAPLVFSKKVMMTQLSPGEEGEWEEEEEEEERREGGGGWKRKKLNVAEALEHHQVVLSNHAAFASFEKQQAAPTAPAQGKSTSGKRMTKEELERINLTRRYQILTKDQEAILQVDKEALERATRRKQMIAEETAAFALNGGGRGSNEYNEKEAGGEKELATAAQEPLEDQRKLPPASAAMESQDTFHTAKSGYSTLKETRQPRRSSAVTAPSPTILHDGNTAKKAEKDRSLISFVGQVKGSALEPCNEADNIPVVTKRVAKGGTRNESFSTVGSPIVVHDGNTAQKKNKSDNTPRRSGKFLPQTAMTHSEDNNAKPTEEAVAYNNCEPVDNADSDAGGFEASQHSSIVSEESLEEPPASDNEPRSPSKEESIVEGSVVMVQARTWPGINKHGGVGRVTRVDSSGHSKKYDVAYILGGKEKGVDESFVSLHEPERSDTAGLTVAARVSISAEKASSRQTRKRISVSMGTAQPVAIPIYNDDELQHIPVDVLAWAGIVRPAKGKGGTTKRKKSKSNVVDNAGAPSKKRVLAESNTNVVPPKKTKKQKATTSKASRDLKAKADHANGTLITFQSATESLTSDELVKRADARYSSLLSSDNDSSVTIYAITSSLSDQDTMVLSSFVKMLKSKNVTVKVTKDFKPGKTQLCITSASAVSSQESNVVSKSRTLKVMRSALLGLPILTPRWMESCISNERIVAPHGDMCVRSLPRKVTTKDDDLALFGVAKYAASVADNISKVLNKCAVLLCGEWKATGQSTMKDLKVLLHDAGATIVNSESIALKMLVDISHDDESNDYVVFLCDDSNLDLDCGVSESLFNAGKLAISQNQKDRRKVLAVHFHWLFDCISCAKVMPGAAYKPLAPRTKALWSLCCESDEQGNDTKV